MKEEQKTDDLKKYAEDIATIKSLLLDVEEKPMIETWAFFVWGGLILIGSLLHYFGIYHWGMELKAIGFKIWLPVLLASIFSETIAWITKMKKESLQDFCESYDYPDDYDYYHHC